MTMTELRNIVARTSELPIQKILTLSGVSASSTIDFFDPALMTYDGLGRLSDGTEIVWGLSPDDDGWELTYSQPY